MKEFMCPWWVRSVTTGPENMCGVEVGWARNGSHRVGGAGAAGRVRKRARTIWENKKV